MCIRDSYYAQQGFRNGKKTTTRNVKKFGKHSELLRITDDPLAYVKEEIRKMNDELRSGKVEMNLTVNFNEKVLASKDAFSQTELLNIGYFYLQAIYQKLHLHQFFDSCTILSLIHI